MNKPTTHAPPLPQGLEEKLPPAENIRAVLVMCSGNICRSPMAEGCLRKGLAERGMADIEVFSAGTLDLEGFDASDESVAVCAEHGIDIQSHRSKITDHAMIERADLILVMEKRHLDFLAAYDAGALKKACLLGDFSPTDPGEEIDDPIQLPIRYYRIAFDRIRQCTDRIVDWLAGRKQVS